CCCTSAISVRDEPSAPGMSMRRAVLISGSESVKTASMTTPLISMILPRFCALDWSDMRLLERLAGLATGARQATHKRRTKSPESSGARAASSLDLEEAERVCRGRHPGGVIELSDARADRRGEHA